MMKPGAEGVRALLAAGLALLAVHEVAEEVLERRAGRQDRAHAVLDLGDVGRRGDVHHRGAQPVGELGEAFGDEARAGVDAEGGGGVRGASWAATGWQKPTASASAQAAMSGRLAGGAGRARTGMP